MGIKKGYEKGKPKNARENCTCEESKNSIIQDLYKVEQLLRDILFSRFIRATSKHYINEVHFN